MAYIGYWKVYWRFKNSADKTWRVGFPSHESGSFVRMGPWNGSTFGGPIVDISEIEYKKAE